MSVGWKKYTRFRFPGGVFKKWGKFSIVVERLDQRWWQWINMWNPTISQEVSRNLPVGPCSNHPRDICFEADYQRIVKQKIEIQLYIISGDGSLEFGRLRRRRTTSSLLHKVREISYWSARTKCHFQSSFLKSAFPLCSLAQLWTVTQ